VGKENEHEVAGLVQFGGSPDFWQLTPSLKGVPAIRVWLAPSGEVFQTE
jgi:hypothetical protein